MTGRSARRHRVARRRAGTALLGAPPPRPPRPPSARTLASSSICHRKPKRPCAACGKVVVAAKRTQSGPVCNDCYTSDHQPKRSCGSCGRVDMVRVRGRNGNPDLCRRCAETERARCDGCGLVRKCTGVRVGRPRCYLCRNVAEVDCGRCGQKHRVAARWPLGPVCRECYRHVRANPGLCAACRNPRPLIGVDLEGRAVCGLCSGAGEDYACRRCGGGEERYRDGCCVRCIARQELDDHFRDQTGCAGRGNAVSRGAGRKPPPSLGAGMAEQSDRRREPTP
jgi:hypothetical protein